MSLRVRRHVLALAVLGAALQAQGCATFSGAGEAANDRVSPEAPLWFNRPSGDLEVFIHRPLTASTRTASFFPETFEYGKPAIDPDSGRVFVGSSDFGLYAVRATDGSTIWRFETIGMVQSEPLYHRPLDVVYFGSNDGALYAVQARDGALMWRFNTGAEVNKRPVVSGETLCFVNSADQLFAVDRRSGRQRWAVRRPPALGMEILGHAGAVVDGDRVCTAFSDGHVGCWDVRDGSERWLVDLSAEAEQQLGAGESQRYLDVDTTPVFYDGPQGRTMFVASYAGGLYQLDAESGARISADEKVKGVTSLVLFHEPEHLPHPDGPDRDGPPVPARDILLAASASTGLWAIELPSRRVLWRDPVPEGGITQPVQVAGAIAVGTTRYGLFLLSALNGRPIDVMDPGTGFSGAPAAYGNRIFALTNAGDFYGLAVAHPIGNRP
jgi:outer membrane protein assembly factor BamB